ncbi:MAG: universal stress protein [Myxococcales bacterium]|nr:universal stress protein [Myxococcales bacterium]
MSDLQRILVPVDFSACSRAAVAYAAYLAGALGAEVEVLHAWRPPQELGPFLGEVKVTDPETGERRTLAEHVEAQARGALDDFVASLREQGIEAGASLVEGPPKRAVLEAAETGRYQLIVMGTHGRTGLAHALLGSVAEWVLRHVAIPVVTVPDPQHETRGAAGTPG